MNQRVSDIMLERYLADDLSAEQRARVEAAVKDSPEAQARLHELDALRESFLTADPPEAFAHRLAVRVAHDTPPARPWWRSLLGPSLAVAVAGAAALFFAVRTEDDAPHLESSFEVSPEADAPPPPAAPGDAAETEFAPKSPAMARERAERDLRAKERSEPPAPFRERPARRAKRQNRGGKGQGEGLGSLGSKRDEGFGARTPRKDAPKPAPKPAPEPEPNAAAAEDAADDAADDADALAGGEADEEALDFAPVEDGSKAKKGVERQRNSAVQQPAAKSSAPRSAAAESAPRAQAPKAPAASAPATSAGPAVGGSEDRVAVSDAVQVSRAGPARVERLGQSVKLRLQGRGFYAILTRHREADGSPGGTLGKLVSLAGQKTVSVRVEGLAQEILVLTSPRSFDPKRYRRWIRFEDVRQSVPGVDRTVFGAPVVPRRTDAVDSEDAAATEAEK